MCNDNKIFIRSKKNKILVDLLKKLEQEILYIIRYYKRGHKKL